jgi:transcription-repair coupling factor (superfamily II helicase)
MPSKAVTTQSSSPIALVKAGQRFAFEGATGSSDALALARYFLAWREKVPLLVVMCASAVDAQRLAVEIPFFAPDARVRLLPDWETLPYDTFSPHQDLVSARLATLHDLGEGRCDILLVPATTALYRMPPASFLAAYTFSFTQGERLNEAKLKNQLTLAGYEHVSQVVRPGEYCVRGSLLDLFPMGSPLPYRIDLFDDQVDSIRAFDPDTQRSLYPVRDVRLLPGREFPFDEPARTAFRSRWREVFEGDPSRSSIYKDIGNGVPAAGIEYYLPLFFDETATLFHYLPQDAQLAMVGDMDAAIKRFTNDTKQRFNFLSHDRERPLLEPKRLFLTEEDFFTFAKPFAQIKFPAIPEGGWAVPLPSLALDRHAEDPLLALRHYLEQTPNRVMFATESAGRRETIQQLLVDNGLRAALDDSFQQWLEGDAKFSLTVAPLANGFVLPDEEIAVITETELYGQLARRPGRRRQEQASNVDSMVRDLSELKIGDPVVHTQHGIGRYMGLVSMDLGEGDTEFLHLEYQNESKLYVPVAQLHVISRYSGADPESAPLHALGSGQWDKAKRRAAQQIRDTAAELLNLYARRALREGHSFPLEARDYAKFAESFGFEETPDQAAAITAVIGDMTSGKPMDRLVCGDVGFGKTEVALRAAFAVALDGKQVAVVVPTTLLARQHSRTFTERFKGFPINVAQASRLVATKELNQVKKGLAEGGVDIVVGTHALLSKSIKFRDLGLLIVDEEQHFGVSHKERLKQLRSQVHVLTLSATPIPRTLQLALTGVRDLSIIASPPVDRLAVRTFVAPHDPLMIREALLRERYRGGQAFYVVPRIEDLAGVKDFLDKNVPEMKVAVAHGQMPPTVIEDIMSAFYDGKYDILLSTTIVESGLDIPAANTLIVHRADMFGLAQLYQLRGRVGRSKLRAYALFTLPAQAKITAQAERRLKVLQSLETLGAGFQLASHDLDLRGAGNLLGDEQSGHIKEVGFELYQSMLEEAILNLKAGVVEPVADRWSPTITIGMPVLIPEDYVNDLSVRLSLYRRLADLDTDEEIDNFAAELRDRFGVLPDEVRYLFKVAAIKAYCRRANVEKVDAGPKGAVITFRDNKFAQPDRLVYFIRQHGNAAKVRPDMKVVFLQDWETPEERLMGTTEILRQLASLAENKKAA